uniref:Non-specific serine/threonine protein kinase n=1 Tax=Meloidogyne incognita TaxID=6306 RepID=A0A914NSB3_MELIC
MDFLNDTLYLIYSITTLSQSSGLIGWVPNCDTLHSLIKDYREKKKIPISEEHNKMQKLCVDIDKCTLLQRVEVFEEALRSTCGDDLRQTLWMKSPNSEVWFDRRTNYTRSMGVMSMVGYILGLGDRHPSNLMLDRLSGKIVHIDFGDCFEVAMKREKYPEKIPFRLTRMLIQAMEVTGIDGNYRLTCERVLRLLRANNDSILAVLESFVYDPMLNWRLTEGVVTAGIAGGGGVGGGTTGKDNTLVKGRVSLPLVEDPNTTTATIPPNINPHQYHPHYLRQQQIQQQQTEEIKPFQIQQQRGEDNEAISRVKAKLCGRDFNPFEPINVTEQVDRLIEQATMNDNLCQCYIGWCPFW